MSRLLFPLCLILFFSCRVTQRYTPSQVFAHNDYVRERPFFIAYEAGAGYIEADVFLENGELMVAHHHNEITPDKTLERLYLQPLSIQVGKLKGNVYQNERQNLILMIDLKTEGISTLDAIIDILKKYPELTTCPTLQFMISGNVPDPQKWENYPGYIHFDGRPNISYTSGQLERILLISTNFRSHAKWDGHGPISETDMQNIRRLMDNVHAKGKKLRFWATPDFPEAWKQLMALNMDVIVTDDVQGLVDFLERH